MAGHLRNKFKTIDAPSVPLGSTFANGINNSGQVVGTVSTELSTTGFLDDAGSFTTFQYPGTLTYASAINNSGQITGFIQAFGINEEGFLYNDSTFTIAVIPANSASYTVFSAINSSGQALANVSGPPNIPSGIYLWDKGISTQVPLSITGATQIYANGLNDRGQIVGYYTDSSQRFHPFLATPAAVSDVEFDNFSCACKVQ
jgi:uncharacterized membrane protein